MAEVGLKVFRKEPMAYALGLGVGGVRPVVGGGGMVANRQRGDEMLLLVTSSWCFSECSVRFVSGPNGWITHVPC